LENANVIYICNSEILIHTQVVEELQKLPFNSKCDFSNHFDEHKPDQLYQDFYQCKKKLQLQINYNKKCEFYRKCATLQVSSINKKRNNYNKLLI